jgi:PAT family beta-lactamase induction signal transducer AmpG
MLFLGFSAGLPLLLIFSSLSLWLREAGIERAAVTFFSWAALGYSFKFVWAPLVDRLPVPLLSARLGRRRAWLLLAQLAVTFAIVWMALTDPGDGEYSLTVMAAAAIVLGFSSATQDIVIDAYRIESADVELQALMSSTYIAGYRVGMLFAGAGALLLAGFFGSTLESYSYTAWMWTYLIMALAMLVGIITTLVIPEPDNSKGSEVRHQSRDYLGLLLVFLVGISGFVTSFFISADFAAERKTVLVQWLGNTYLAGFLVEAVRLFAAILLAFAAARLVMMLNFVNRSMVEETYVEPLRDFFRRYGYSLAWLLLALIGLYRISDIVLGIISNVFYQDIGFSKNEIASVVKTFGLLMTIVGGLFGGVLAVRFGVMRILLLGAILSAATNLLFILLAHMGHNIVMLYAVISADNLSAGLASAAFVAFLSSLTNISFTAVQYAIFSSLMTLLPKLLGGYSGTLVDSIGYPLFFSLTALIGLPVLLLILLAGKSFEVGSRRG